MIVLPTVDPNGNPRSARYPALPVTSSHQRYWKANLTLVAVLLAVWAFVSFGCGILLAPWLDRFTLPGTEYPLGFWFAQQGSIYVFVLLIVIYVVAMNRLDRRYAVDGSGGEAGDEPTGRTDTTAKAGDS